MNGYPFQMDDFVKELSVSKTLVFAGTFNDIRIEAILDGNILRLCHNLGGNGRPDKNRAINLIESMEQYYFRLCTDEKFKNFMRDKTLEIELYVFSGHMDFSVALKKNQTIEWRTVLD